MQNLWTINHYHIAYYAAVSAVERGELALRYREPWFIGTGGFIGTTWLGPVSDISTDIISSGDDEGIRWTINSRTQTIPAVGMGNTDSMFQSSDSADYNMLGYNSLENLILSYDDTTNIQDYYTWVTTMVYFTGTSFTGLVRLPPKIFSGFGLSTQALLCDSIAGNDCDPDGDGIYDDLAVNWSLAGLYQGEQFKILPTVGVFYYNGMQIDAPNDTIMRESWINATWTGQAMFASSYTPVVNGASLAMHNVVSVDDTAIAPLDFATIFQNVAFTWLRLTLGVPNLLRSFNENIYPYLEYQFSFPQSVADRFYSLQWNGRVGEYDVQISIKKPTAEWTVGGDFTVIF